jgi:putative peptidoglycan lipid II flippase
MSETSPKSRSFLHHARLIGMLTLLSRILGLAREVVAGHFLGTKLVASAFTMAFIVPNLFRKLLGEGALSAAFIPLYAQAEKRGATESGETAQDFAAGSVNLLILILLGITIVGEAGLGAWMFATGNSDRTDRTLMLQFTSIMLPYVVLVCGGAFLSAILQVHKRFGPPAFAPVVLNVCHIGVVLLGARILGLRGNAPMTDYVIALQTKLAFALAVTVLVAGAMQVLILLPALRQIGFRFRPSAAFWTPSTRKMLKLSLPVAMGVGVLQLSVLLDKGISYALQQGRTEEGLVTHFHFAGHLVRYPMEEGAIRRLDLAQLLYQFPLGVFAIALATAIFPNLSAEAIDKDRENFKRVLRQGIEATLWEGLPASVGLILVSEPAVRLLFQHGQIDAHQCTLIRQSVCFYAGAIWAFSMLQVINRAYYALHDSVTPLYASIINIVANLAIEIPLVWWIGESGMAVGTLVSFSIQAIIMLWLLDRRAGGLGLRESYPAFAKMMLSTLVMAGVCLAVRSSPLYPAAENRLSWGIQLLLLSGVGAAVYIGLCGVMKVNILKRH